MIDAPATARNNISGRRTDLSRATCWLVHSGAKGNAVQCEGIAAALGVAAATKIVRPRPPWRWLSPWGPAEPMPHVAPPWPDLAIGTGRYSVPYVRMIGARSGGRTFTVILKNPRARLADFDLVWIPRHDGVGGDNVVTTVTSPHPFTPADLERERGAFAEAFAALPRPLVGVMVGGGTRYFRLGAAEIDRLASDLIDLARSAGAGLAVACSRRTGAALAGRLAGRLRPHGAVVWTGEADGPNPYLAILGAADALIVTCESTNMVGEAAFTGVPVLMYRLPGASPRFARFHDGMIASGAARWFQGRLERWSYAPLNATQEIAAAVRAGYEAAPARR